MGATLWPSECHSVSAWRDFVDLDWVALGRLEGYTVTHNDSDANVGRVVATRMEELGMKEDDLAARSNLPLSAVRGIMNGTRRVTDLDRGKLAAALRIPKSFLEWQ